MKPEPGAAGAHTAGWETAGSRRQLWIMAAYGLLAGLPLPLSGFTFRLWLSEGGVSLPLIGVTANIALAYSLKFLWAPILDHTAPPSGLRRLGRRRGWLVAIQSALALAVACLSASDPVATPVISIGLAGLVAFLSSSQDIVIDAWRIETFPRRLQGAALAAYVWGYRVALLLATSGVIAAADRIGWHLALLVIAGLIALGPLVTYVTPLDQEPVFTSHPGPVGASARIRDALLAPLTDFLQRPGAWNILAFVSLFKLGEAMAGIMTPPFYRSLGFNRETIAGIGPFSLAGTLAGITLGGWLVARIGTGRALLRTGWMQTIAMGMYVLLALPIPGYPMLFATVTVEAFAQGMADAAFLTYLSALCSTRFTATQYALLSSLPAFTIHTLGGVSGLLAERLGWFTFYAICMLTAVPGMFLMLRLLRRTSPAATLRDL